MLILILIQIAQSEFRVESPDDLKDSQIRIYPALFGNPTFYSMYGKIQVMKDCKFNKLLEYETVVVLTNSSECCLLETARKVRNSGGRGLVVVQDEAKMIEKDCEGDDPNIMVLSLSRNDYKKHFHNAKNIWITYRYMLFQSSYPFIEVKLTGDFLKDLIITQEFIKLNSKFAVHWEYVRFQLMASSHSTYPENDCLSGPSNRTYCLPSDEVFGTVKLEAYVLILNVYERFSSPNSTANFLIFLRSVFQNCNYNSTCIFEISKNYIKNLRKSFSALDRYLTYEETPSRFVINSVDIYWFGYLESAFCLSFAEQPQECEFCSPGCSFKSLRSTNCSIFCDNIHCGFSNLRCQREKGCFRFLLGDGNCNEMCIDDPDCNQDGEYLRFFLYSVIACCFVVFIV
jgi:hypothetical protein